MRWLIVFFLLGVLGVGAYIVWFRPQSVISPISQLLEKPLDKYTIERLSRRVFAGSQIVFDEPVATTSGYTVYQFYFLSENKRVTGLAHVPAGASAENKKPVIVQFRGYVDREKYAAGEGTRRSAEVFAKNGFISLAPDFLGYGGSASPSADIFEERFETYTTGLNLLASIKTLPMADPDRIGVWGHSNGGQIALTVLEVSSGRAGSRSAGQKPYPTTLWAPVSKPFPYSILYYTDDAKDHGKMLRRELAKFENDYDAEQYSLINYLDRIAAPLQIHQGTADDAVPKKWSDELVKVLKEKKKDVDYFVYPGADHNMVGAWNTVVSRDIEFFQKHLK